MAQPFMIAFLRDSGGRTPLYYAAIWNDKNPVAAVQVLVDAGANIEAKDNDGRTPLELAIAFGSPEGVVQALQGNGASQ